MDPEFRTPDLTGFLSRPTEPELELPRLFQRDAALTIFDIGACEGEDSIRYSKLYPRSHVYTFEPLPENQALVLEHFKHYQVKNAELVSCALSNKTGTAEFHVSSGKPPHLFEGENWNYGNKSSSLLSPASNEPMFGWIEFKKAITVSCKTLDEFCQERNIRCIDFIHMDVQGAETLVLQGASLMLNNITAIWLEVSEQRLYQGQGLRSEVEKIMKDAGFILAFQSLREIEGDQFYVNRRDPRALAYLAKRKTHHLASLIKRKLGGIKRRSIKLLRRNSENEAR